MQPGFYDVVLMFKVLILQRLHNLSDRQVQKDILNMLTFQGFLRLCGLNVAVPDEKTIWLIRKHLTDAGLIDSCFQKFDAFLREQGVLIEGGTVINYTTTPANVHDSPVVEELIGERMKETELYGDKAYSGRPIRKALAAKRIVNRIHEKGRRDRPLTDK